MIKSPPDLVRNVIKAYPYRKEALAALRKYLKADDIEALTETYETIGLTLLPEKPYSTLKGIDVMLRELSGKEPKAQAARPEQFVDLTFVKELDSSGFMDHLYKATPVVSTRQRTGRLRAPVVAKENVPSAKDRAKPAIVPAAEKSAWTVLGASILPQEYTVNAGDTLSQLALRFYGSAHK